MTPQLLFNIIIGILILSFSIDKILDYLNAKHFNDVLPDDLNGIYNDEEYIKSQQYKSINFRFSLITSAFSIILILLFFAFDGFAFVDTWARTFSNNPIIVTLIFFGLIFIANDLIMLPFSYYKTFVIEEKFGFNKSSKKTFVLDKIKSWFMLAIFGGGLVALITWFYNLTTDDFWLYAWALITAFSIFMNMFYRFSAHDIISKKISFSPILL